jgi:hypothetical protein
MRAKAQVLATLDALAKHEAAPVTSPSPAPAPAPAPVEPVAVMPPARRPTAEEIERQSAAAQAAQALRIEQHRAEPRDDAWASAMESRIDVAIRPRAEGGTGKYEGAECRSQTCVVDFSWASLAEARADLRAMMSRTVSLPCATSLVLPADDGSGDRIRAPVYLDCSADRRSETLSASR